MNATLCKPELLAHDPFHDVSETPAPQDLFATAPVKAIWLEFDWQSAEEAYTSFEAAISNRILALKERHISTQRHTPSALNRLAKVLITTWRKGYSKRTWQHGVALVGMALVLMLAGFDLMGVLVLYAR